MPPENVLMLSSTPPPTPPPPTPPVRTALLLSAAGGGVVPSGRGRSRATKRYRFKFCAKAGECTKRSERRDSFAWALDARHAFRYSPKRATPSGSRRSG